jgi:hypothetical protein
VNDQEQPTAIMHGALERDETGELPPASEETREAVVEHFPLLVSAIVVLFVVVATTILRLQHEADASTDATVYGAAIGYAAAIAIRVRVRTNE